ncbi:lipocalin family protein [Phenylobacterium aquaticum]|uniref:lipocalin family protein n=1 Tax=Phenylobacterium aquaticum TaxID=1763816 RepID=UPI0026F0B51C|nr:lipocalin family protein [Phenylobacterium aquaticum]
MRILPFALCAVLALALPAGMSAAAPAPPPAPTDRIELTKMTGRWYEVARLPNHTQKDCQAGVSDWARDADGYDVLQVCHRGSVSAPPTEWKAKAKVLDPKTNAKFKMSFFGGLVSQEYWVLDHKTDQGWLILGTPNGKYLWLMSQHPLLGAGAKAQAVARIKQLGYDVSALEYPQPARN